MEEKKKPEDPKKEEDKPEADKPPPAEGGKKEEKKSEEPKSEEKAAAVPPLPPEIVLKVYMHCEGCARKVRRCLKGFEGVEDVITDCKASRVVVRGEKADPVKVLDRVQRKSHRQVELISPIPKPPPPEEPKKTGVKDVPKAEDKKPEQPAVVTVVLGVYMHCEACAQEIKKRILKMKGVESVEPELKSSQVKVKGTIEPEKLVDHVYKRTGKHATVVKVEPEKKKEDEKPKEGKEDKKSEEGEKGKKEAEKEAAKTAGGGGGEQLSPVEAEEDSKLELRKNESNYCYPQQQNHQFYPQFYPPQRFVQETYSYPPQMFSDENPNACTVM